MSLGDSPSPVVPDECHVIEQIVGKKGDIVVCHPWVIHSGTTNMGDAARLMCNGMVTIKRDAFERVGCMVLRGTGRK